MSCMYVKDSEAKIHSALNGVMSSKQRNAFQIPRYSFSLSFERYCVLKYKHFFLCVKRTCSLYTIIIKFQSRNKRYKFYLKEQKRRPSVDV